MLVYMVSILKIVTRNLKCMFFPFIAILTSILYLILFFGKPYLRRINLIVLGISIFIFTITGILFNLADENIFNSPYLSPPIFDFIGLVLIITPAILNLKRLKMNK